MLVAFIEILAIELICMKFGIYHFGDVPECLHGVPSK